MTLHPLSTFDGAGDTLARMVAKGHCTLNDLDKTPPGAVTGYRSRNLLRDWIAVNQAKWQQILDEHNVQPEPVVEACPSLRDFPTNDLPF